MCLGIYVGGRLGSGRSGRGGTTGGNGDAVSIDEREFALGEESANLVSEDGAEFFVQTERTRKG